MGVCALESPLLAMESGCTFVGVADNGVSRALTAAFPAKHCTKIEDDCEDTGVTDDSGAAARELGRILTMREWTMATAESVTGGAIAATCTEVPGASGWFAAGLVTYTAAMKRRLVDVPLVLVRRYGVVSEPVARAMAEGARRATDVDFTIAVTGIAGPDGGEVLQPVGTVWFAWSQPGCATTTQVRQFTGDRAAVRSETVAFALQGALALLAH